MTVTTLAEIEACPRRWALGAAEYPALWTARGYPPGVNVSTLGGTVVHLALEQITNRLVAVGCSSFQDPGTVDAMRDLGGFTKVVNDCVDRVLTRLTDNPRAKRHMESVEHALRAQVSELRTRVQTMLSRLRLPEISVARIDNDLWESRGPLTCGVFSELELRAPQIGWKGKADLLVLSPERCEITDLKTGEPQDEHRFQIEVYALLWSRDSELNPEGRAADRLVLSYGGRDIDVPAPSAAELDDLERRIVARRDAAHRAVSQEPPEARPHPLNCGFCGVRHLCDEYWSDKTQRAMALEGEDSSFADIEVCVVGKHGPSSWDAVIEYSSIGERGHRILVRSNDPPFQLRSGQRLRLLSAHVSSWSEQNDGDRQSVIIATVGRGTETYLVPQ